MKQEILTKVLDIVKLNESLENLYNKLAELEINHKENSSEYDKYVSYIQMSLDIINKKIRNLNISDEDLIEIDDTIAQLNGFDEDNDIVIDLLELCTNNKIRRTCMQLYAFSRENNCGYTIENIESDYIDENIDEDEQKEINELSEELLIDEIEKEDEIDLLKDKLLSHTLMAYLLDAIKNEENIEIKNELIRVKYRLIYILKDLERSFINTPNKFIKLPIYQELLKYKEQEQSDLFEELYTEPIKDTVIYELDYLSKLDDEYYKNIKNQVRVILRVLYIKSYLSINYDLSLENEIKNKLDAIILETKSHISKENVKKSFELKKELSVPKKVDLY